LDFAAVELSVLGPHLAEKFASGAGGAREERHRRVKLQVVGVAKTRFERPSTLFTSSVQVQPSAEHRVGEVCLRLLSRRLRASCAFVGEPGRGPKNWRTNWRMDLASPRGFEPRLPP
jgi:hypothetical protein